MLTNSARRKTKGKKEEEEEKGIEDFADAFFGGLLHYVTTDVELAKKLRGMGHIPIVDGILPGVTGLCFVVNKLTSVCRRPVVKGDTVRSRGDSHLGAH